jgi:hypothetical protein
LPNKNPSWRKSKKGWPKGGAMREWQAKAKRHAASIRTQTRRAKKLSASKGKDPYADTGSIFNPKKPRTKMVKAPKGWIKAKAVRVVRRGGKRIVEVKR